LPARFRDSGSCQGSNLCPLKLAAELTLALAPRARAKGLLIVWKSNGFVTQSALPRLADAVDPDIPWHILRFDPDHRLLLPPPTSPTLLTTAVELAHAAGLRHVYIERALSDAARTTRCPKCTAVLVEREPWSLRVLHLDADRCYRCRTPLPGVWSARAAGGSRSTGRR